MVYSLDRFALVAAILLGGRIVQGAVGFASGLIGVPLLVLTGLSLPEAATINVVSTSVQNVIGAWRLWPHLEPRELPLPVVLRWLGIPLGVTALAYVDGLDPQRVRQLIGVLLLAIVLLLQGLRFKPRPRLHLGWQVTAFLSSGFMLGFSSMGGAPTVLYVNALTWTANKSRAFLFFCSASGMPVMAYFLWRNFGDALGPAVSTAALGLPAVLAGLWLGLRLGNHLDKHVFRRLTFIILTLIAIGSILGPMLTSK